MARKTVISDQWSVVSSVDRTLRVRRDADFDKAGGPTGNSRNRKVADSTVQLDSKGPEDRYFAVPVLRTSFLDSCNQNPDLTIGAITYRPSGSIGAEFIAYADYSGF